MTAAAPPRPAAARRPSSPSAGGARLPGVLIAVPWDQREGGVATVVRHLAADLRARGHEVVFLFPEEVRGVVPRTTAWGFTGYAMNLRPPAAAGHPLRAPAAFAATAAATALRLRRIVRRHGLSIVNVHYPVEPFVHLALLRAWAPVRLVTSAHGSDLLPNGRARSPLPGAVRMLLARSDRIVAPSAAYRDALLRAYPQLAGRTEVIHNGVEVDELAAGRRAPVEDAQPYVLCLAHYAPWKGQDVLVRAFARIAPRHPWLRLVLAGDGGGRAETRALARALGVEARVELLDEQPRERVAELLHGCALFVLPSRAESFGIALVEAMACGRPVIGTRVGGIPEIVCDGRDGVLVPPDDPAALAAAMERLLADPAAAQAMGARAREAVRRRFRAEHAGAAYRALFASLAPAAPRRIA
ncbi:MAG TPA: glycosyltransferase family 4 protein [Longimicrobium sp.]|nr:glycosyltransferase family 4 protein [Longimicrobium sp.]